MLTLLVKLPNKIHKTYVQHHSDTTEQAPSAPDPDAGLIPTSGTQYETQNQNQNRNENQNRNQIKIQNLPQSQPLSETHPFPSSFNIYTAYTTNLSSGFNLGQRQDRPLYAVSIRGGLFSSSATLILHTSHDKSPPLATADILKPPNGRTFLARIPPPSSSPETATPGYNDTGYAVVSTAGYERGTPQSQEPDNVHVRVPAPSSSPETVTPGHDAGYERSGPETQAPEDVRVRVSEEVHFPFQPSYSFAFPVGPDMQPEMFEWRRSSGAEVNSLWGGLGRGWKLVRLSAAEAHDRSRGTKGPRGVVAVWAPCGVLGMSKRAAFKFVGAGETGELGPVWCVVVVISMLRLFQIETSRRRSSVVDIGAGAGSAFLD